MCHDNVALMTYLLQHVIFNFVLGEYYLEQQINNLFLNIDLNNIM